MKAVTPPNTLATLAQARITELHAQGGPGEADFELATLVCWALATRGDELLGNGGKAEGKLLEAMACTLAICAFAPGGITFAGVHYEAYATQN